MYVPKVRRARLLLHLRLIRLKAQRAENFCGIVTTCKNYYRFESHHIQSSFVPLFVSTSFNVSLNIYFWFCTMWLLVQLGGFSWVFALYKSCCVRKNYWNQRTRCCCWYDWIFLHRYHIANTMLSCITWCITLLHRFKCLVWFLIELSSFFSFWIC